MDTDEQRDSGEVREEELEGNDGGETAESEQDVCDDDTKVEEGRDSGDEDDGGKLDPEPQVCSNQ